MICYGCGEKIDENMIVCPNCGIKLKENINVENRKKEINKKFLGIGSILIVLFACIVLFVVFYMIFMKGNKEKLVNNYCDGKSYIDNVLISDIIDNYECAKFASYMIDTKGREISSVHIDYLVSLSDISVYEIFAGETGSLLTYSDDRDILDPMYYEYLYTTDREDVFTEDKYEKLIYSSYNDGNFDLFKNLLKLYFKREDANKNIFDFGGTTYGGLSESEVSRAKKGALEREEFVLEYRKYDDRDYYLVYMFSRNLFNQIPKDKIVETEMYEILRKNAYAISLSDLKNYRSWGGIFYNNEKYDSILKEYAYKTLERDPEYEQKFKYLIDECRKDGYDVKYSDLLDRYVYYFDSSVNYKKNEDILKKGYRVLVNAGFKCYENCFYTDSFE